MDLRPDDIASALDEARQKIVVDVELSVVEERRHQHSVHRQQFDVKAVQLEYENLYYLKCGSWGQRLSTKTLVHFV